MAFRPLETIKEHPYLAAGGVFVLGVILVIILSSGSSEPANAQTVVGVGTDPNTVAANTALVQGQLAAGVANQQTAAQLAVSMADIQATAKIEELRSQNDASQIAGQTQVALATLSAQKDTQNLVSTLSAQVSQSQIAAQQAIAANSNATNVQIAKLNSESQVQMQSFMRDVQNGAQRSAVELAMITANRDIQITTANNAAQAAMAGTFAQASVATTMSNNATQLGLANTYAGVYNNQIAAAKDTALAYVNSQNYMAGLDAATQQAQIAADAAKAKYAQDLEQQHKTFVTQTNANLQNWAMYKQDVLAHATLYQQAQNPWGGVTGVPVDWSQFGKIAA